jgi:cytochrome c oxidase subunit 2
VKRSDGEVVGAADSRGPYDALLSVYGQVAAIVFVAVAVALILVVMRSRRSRGDRGAPRTGAPTLELAYAIGLAVVAALLLWRSYDAMSDDAPFSAERVAAASASASAAGARDRGGPADLTIGIVASRWNWRLGYPGGVVQTGDGAGRPATLVVPAQRTVRFRLTSRDVVHALWIPALRAKFDAVPGYTNGFALRFAAGLDYSTARCSEFCGEQHDEMRLRIDVRSPDAFAAWLKRRQAEARAA